MNVFMYGAPSSAGRVSGQVSGMGLPSACSSLGVFVFDGECLLLVQVELKKKKNKKTETQLLRHFVRLFYWRT